MFQKARRKKEYPHFVEAARAHLSLKMYDLALEIGTVVVTILSHLYRLIKHLRSFCPFPGTINS